MPLTLPPFLPPLPSLSPLPLSSPPSLSPLPPSSPPFPPSLLSPSLPSLLAYTYSDSESKTQWELYQQKRKEKRKETKKKIQKKGAKEEEEGEMGTDSGFDDPFFQHSVTVATSVSVCIYITIT